MSLGRFAHVLLRFGVGLLFFEHGLQKMSGVSGGFGGAGMTAPLGSLFGAAGVVETLGGALLILGLMARPVAVILMIEMISAYFIAAARQGGGPVQYHGELALLYTLVLGYIAGSGAGVFSVDRLFQSTWRLERRKIEGDRRHPLAVSM